jgi:hypothetical protein
MFDALASAGVDVFVAWFSRLFGEDTMTYTFDEYPGVEFMIRDVAHTMHEMLQIDENYGYDMQSFLDLLQRTGTNLESDCSTKRKGFEGGRARECIRK